MAATSDDSASAAADTLNSRRKDTGQPDRRLMRRPGSLTGSPPELNKSGSETTNNSPGSSPDLKEEGFCAGGAEGKRKKENARKLRLVSGVKISFDLAIAREI